MPTRKSRKTTKKKAAKKRAVKRTKRVAKRAKKPVARKAKRRIASAKRAATRALLCQETHQRCKSPSTDSYCDMDSGHSGSHHCKECGNTF